MALHFQLIDKVTNKAEDLIKVDEKICQLLDVKIDPVSYVFGWFDSIGFGLACGNSFQDIISDFKEQSEKYEENKEFYLTLIRITEFLEKNYTSHSWYGR